ncbi:putative NBP2b protein [Besnoitia besnoiti]|uniref:Putative NBP2b protein n=1 Tax=Besnoitia besnoiti TaxID=94643 RepID=A0A2A9M5Z7_BESBE|nr:putative NBP2b protein [Besnoitia besnoiti]PFH33359.1 putative NBP2b protein [Besnoitia besnoiti]
MAEASPLPRPPDAPGALASSDSPSEAEAAGQLSQGSALAAPVSAAPAGCAAASKEKDKSGLESSDPKTRIAFRRARAEERLAKAATQKEDPSADDGPSAAPTAGEAQGLATGPLSVAESFVEAEVRALESRKQAAWKKIKSLADRLADERERATLRREELAAERKEDLRAAAAEVGARREAVKASLAFATSSSGSLSASPPSSVSCLGALRNRLLKIQCPAELAEAFEDAQNKCEAIQKVKNEQEKRLDEEETFREAVFVSTLAEQKEEVVQLLDLMREQYRELRDNYREALDRIEAKMAAERGALLQRNKEELDAIFERRQNMEEHEIIEARQKRLEAFAAALEQQSERDELDSQARKLKQETTIQAQEKHLDKMIAAYQLNKEKLEYNLQVLTERNKENLALVLAYKNRLNRRREALSGIVERFNAMNQKYTALNIQCTEEFKRLRSHSRQIWEKSLHFRKADARIYREVWKANEQEARELIAALMEANRCIHAQQLCLPCPPVEAAEPNGFPEDTDGGDVSSEAATTTFRSASSSGKDNSSFARGQPSSSASGGKSCSRSKDGSEGVSGGAEGRLSKSVFSSTKVKKVLDLISDACHFLAGPKAQACEELSAEEQQLLDANAILQNVGVDCQDELDLLVSIFYQGQDDDDETLYVDADDVLRLLEDFMEEKRNLAVAEVLPDKKRKKRRQAQARTPPSARRTPHATHKGNAYTG